MFSESEEFKKKFFIYEVLEYWYFEIELEFFSDSGFDIFDEKFYFEYFERIFVFKISVIKILSNSEFVVFGIIFIDRCEVSLYLKFKKFEIFKY